jgi:hypothetical protein
LEGVAFGATPPEDQERKEITEDQQVSTPSKELEDQQLVL